jgi:hypothetical protein
MWLHEQPDSSLVTVRLVCRDPVRPRIEGGWLRQYRRTPDACRSATGLTVERERAPALDAGADQRIGLGGVEEVLSHEGEATERVFERAGTKTEAKAGARTGN